MFRAKPDYTASHAGSQIQATQESKILQGLVEVKKICNYEMSHAGSEITATQTASGADACGPEILPGPTPDCIKNV